MEIKSKTELLQSGLHWLNLSLILLDIRGLFDAFFFKLKEADIIPLSRLSLSGPLWFLPDPPVPPSQLEDLFCPR